MFEREPHAKMAGLAGGRKGMRLAVVLVVLGTFVNFSLAKTVCPDVSACVGCCATDPKNAAACAAIKAKAPCASQIACTWSDGPATNGTVNAIDFYDDLDDTFPSCYQSESLTALVEFMKTLKDKPSETHNKGPPVYGDCNACYTDTMGRHGVTHWTHGPNETKVPNVNRYWGLP